MAILTMPKLNSRLGTYRAYHLAAITFIAAFISGYDSGVAGGVLSYATFERNYGYKGTAAESRVDSLTIGLSQAGSWVAAMLIYPITNAFGRRWAIMGSVALFMIGNLLQTINTGSLAAWYVGRVVSGLGIGGFTVVVPMFSAEMTPKEIRGRCGSFYQWMYTWGIFLAYWVDYGVEKNTSIAKTSAIYQIPIGLQFVPASVMLVGTFFLPESVRWLLSKDRGEQAWKSLTWIRGDDGDVTYEEFKQTELGFQAEQAAKARVSVRDMFLKENRLRFIVGPLLFVFQNTTGSSALAVFAPQYFKVLVGANSESRLLLLSGLFGAVKLIACTFFIWVLSERLGRRTLLTGGGAVMAACMLITALIAKYVPTTDASGAVTSGGKATVAMIYIDIMVYNNSWGPLPWAYVPEIFPTRIRSLGLAISMLAHWATSVTFTVASPYMIANIGAWTFLVFMGFDIIAAVFCFIFVKETRGQQLERAAGTEWEVLEKSLVDPEITHVDADRKSSLAPVQVGEDGELVDEVHGKRLAISAVHDTFSTNLKRRG